MSKEFLEEEETQNLAGNEPNEPLGEDTTPEEDENKEGEDEIDKGGKGNGLI